VVEPPPTPVITVVPPEIPEEILEIPDIVLPDITLLPVEIPDIILPDITLLPVEVTMELPSPLPQSTPANPEWVFYMMGFMGLVIILLLVTILVLVVMRR
jgi:hypothetical protein